MPQCRVNQYTISFCFCFSSRAAEALLDVSWQSLVWSSRTWAWAVVCTVLSVSCISIHGLIADSVNESLQSLGLLSWPVHPFFLRMHQMMTSFACIEIPLTLKATVSMNSYQTHLWSLKFQTYKDFVPHIQSPHPTVIRDYEWSVKTTSLCHASICTSIKYSLSSFCQSPLDQFSHHFFLPPAISLLTCSLSFPPLFSRLVFALAENSPPSSPRRNAFFSPCFTHLSFFSCMFSTLAKLPLPACSRERALSVAVP